MVRTSGGVKLRMVFSAHPMWMTRKTFTSMQQEQGEQKRAVPVSAKHIHNGGCRARKANTRMRTSELLLSQRQSPAQRLDHRVRARVHLDVLAGQPEKQQQLHSGREQAANKTGTRELS